VKLPELPDIPSILEVLVRHEVDFVVIGGVAVAHHGYVRATKDVDIVPQPTRDNLFRLWSALEELEARPALLQEFGPEELPAPFTVEGLLELGNWNLDTRFGQLELLQYVGGKVETAEDYDRLRAAAASGRYEFGTVWVADYEDLIDFKNIAGRDLDLVDIRALREARGDTGPR
jgi:hypothetical protein